jgi:phytoene dehydrogenase-like protein
MAEKSIVIVGGGVAGLCAGCYARMNGYETKIVEMHSLPGGVCTAWTRDGYTIDSCIHWLAGSAPGVGYHKLWREVGAVQGFKMLDLEIYTRIEGQGGKVLNLYGDVDRLEQHLLELAPEDARELRSLTKAIRKFSGFDMRVDKAPELYTLGDKLGIALSMIPYGNTFMRWKSVTVSGFAKRLKNPFLRTTFTDLASDAQEFPMLALIMPLAWLNRKVAGYPYGGSLPFARAIEKRFLDLGGAIEYGTRVTEILTEKADQDHRDRAVGVRLEDGTEHRADVVISAADGHATIFDMLGGRYIDDTTQRHYDTLQPFPPLLYISLGINDPLSEIPSTIGGITFPLDPEVEIDGKLRKQLGFKTYNFDPAIAPAGKSVIILMLNSDYDRWVALHEDPQRYAAAKQAACDAVIDALEQRIPGLRDKIEMRDVATPVTWNRFTGNWRGSFEGWLPSGTNLNMQMKKTLPRLDDFYMIGHWTTPGGGLPPAVSGGRHVIQLICKRDRKRFVATEP